MIALTGSPTHFVADEANLDHEPAKQVLHIPGVVFRQAIGLAEVTSSTFRAPARQFFPRQGEAFAEALQNALDNQDKQEAPRRLSGQTARDQLYAFFSDSTHRRWLAKLLAFLDKTPGFSVVN